jgi:hypothetical protein
MTAVHDMNLPTMITVTADHIASGRPGESCLCPIALAIADAVRDLPSSGHAPHVTVSSFDVIVKLTWTDWRAELPGSGQGFIAAFDAGAPVGPFTFELTWRRHRDHHR